MAWFSAVVSSLVSLVQGFQSKLGNYDKQLTEQSVEQRILQGIDNHDRKEDKAFLIDVDVVRGSVFAKNKPRHGWSHAFCLGIFRAAFAPLHWDYWCQHTSFRWSFLIMFHFFLQLVQAVCFLLIEPDSSNSSQDDVIIPCLLAICLGVLHAHITPVNGCRSGTVSVTCDTHGSSAMAVDSVDEPTARTTAFSENTPSQQIQLSSGNESPSHLPPSISEVHNVSFHTNTFAELPTKLNPSIDNTRPPPATSRFLSSTTTLFPKRIPVTSSGPPIDRFSVLNSDQIQGTGCDTRTAGAVHPECSIGEHAVGKTGEADDADLHNLKSSSAAFLFGTQPRRPPVSSYPTQNRSLIISRNSQLAAARRQSHLKLKCGHEADVETSESDGDCKGKATDNNMTAYISNRLPENPRRLLQLPNASEKRCMFDNDPSSPCRCHLVYTVHDDRSSDEFRTTASLVPSKLTSEFIAIQKHLPASVVKCLSNVSTADGSRSSPKGYAHGICSNKSIRPIRLLRQRSAPANLACLGRQHSRSASPSFNSAFSALSTIGPRTHPSECTVSATSERVFQSTSTVACPLTRSLIPVQRVLREPNALEWSSQTGLCSSKRSTSSYSINYSGMENSTHDFGFNSHRGIRSDFANLSDVTMSSDGSSSSLLLPSQTARVSHSRHLNVESVDEVGGGVHANPKCSTHLDPKLVTSPSSEINDRLSDHAGPLKVKTDVSKSPAIIQLATADLAVGSFVSKIDESQTRDHSPTLAPVQSTDGPLSSVHLDSKDGAVTSVSRQRTKFLQLFLQRASGLQPVNHFRSACSHEKLDECHEVSAISHPMNVVSPVDARTSASTSSSPRALDSVMWNNKPRLARRDSPNRCVNWSHLARGEHHNNCTRRVVIPSLRRKSRYRSRRCWANESPQEEYNRAQTASETEYDRLNSDVGSNVESSSSPDEVEPPPSSSANQPTVPWKTGATRRQAARNVAFEIDESLRQRITAVAKSATKQPPRQKRHRMDCALKLNFSRNSGYLTTCHAPSKEPWIDSNETPESDVPSGPMPHANVSLSNAETGFMPVVLRESNVPPVEPPLNDEIPIRSTCKVPPEQLVNHVPLHDPIAKNWSSRSSTLTDTVRCYVWEGENVSKFDLTMLDIGCNVIRAVERQGISTDYIILACIATICLPMLSVAFHWNALQSQQTVVNGTELVDAAASATPAALLVSRLSTGSSDTVVWPTAPILCDTLLGMQLRMIYQLMVQVSTIFGQPLRWLAALLPVDEASIEHEIAWETFRTLITGRWFISWLRAPDLQGRFVIILGIILRFNIYAVIFFLLCIAERTFQQRLLYAKYFFSLTSARRARKYHVPQFRLNKLRHIKCWLTLRSYLKKRGPQRSVEAIIAAAFYIVFVFGLGLCSQLLSRKDTSVFSHLTNWDILGLVLAIMVFLHRFIILGTKITNKYRNFSVLITEQINLYLSIEKKPHKKDELMSTLQVLRLVESLLKEVDGPFRVCGWTVNPLVYNVFKLVLLSCFSSLLSETLGFKLKLYKLKLNAANW